MNADRNSLDERKIRESIAGNDKQLVRLFARLSMLDSEQVIERVGVLTQLATRFSLLAAQTETGYNSLTQEKFEKWVEYLLLTPSEKQSVCSSRPPHVGNWYEEAIRYYSLVIQLQPSVVIYNSRALVRCMLGEVGDSIVDLTRAIRFASLAAKAHLYYQRGLVYLSLGDGESGNTNFLWAIRIDPQYQEKVARFRHSPIPSE